MNQQELEKRFKLHPLTSEQYVRVEQIRDALTTVATVVDSLVTDGREKSLALTHLEESVFWAVAAIAREGA